MNKILITGGVGFIGTHLARLLIKEGYRVCSLDLRDPANRVSDVEYIRGDILEKATLYKSAEGASAIVHFAAIVSVPLCQKNPEESTKINVGGTQSVLECAREKGQRVIFASSAAVYGATAPGDVGLKEAQVLPPPLSFYAEQKATSETFLHHYHQAFGLETVCFRFFNVYGQGQDPNSPYSGVISIFNSRIEKGQALELHGGGKQTRDFVAVTDVARACLAALTLKAHLCDGQPINVGSGKPVSVRALGEIMMAAKNKQVSLSDLPAREGDVPHSLANIDRARAILGWQPSVSLEEGLREL